MAIYSQKSDIFCNFDRYPKGTLRNYFKAMQYILAGDLPEEKYR